MPLCRACGAGVGIYAASGTYNSEGSITMSIEYEHGSGLPTILLQGLYTRIGGNGFKISGTWNYESKSLEEGQTMNFQLSSSAEQEPNEGDGYGGEE
jgi:hypothetical protein